MHEGTCTILQRALASYYGVPRTNLLGGCVIPFRPFPPVLRVPRQMRVARILLVLTGAAAWRLPVPGRQRTIDHRRSRPRMGADWRPETVDPLGKAMGEAFGVSQFERTQELWLDLRTSENTFAQM